MRPTPPISAAPPGHQQTEKTKTKTPREHFTGDVEDKPAKFDHKERTLQQAGFGRNQHIQPAEPNDSVTRTRLLSPAEIWRR
jgi:hypothetical protein